MRKNGTCWWPAKGELCCGLMGVGFGVAADAFRDWFRCLLSPQSQAVPCRRSDSALGQTPPYWTDQIWKVGNPLSRYSGTK